MIPGKSAGFWTVEERDRLLAANGGTLSAALMDELKGITTAHVIKALAPFLDETGLPRHLPMAVDADGHGPVDKTDVESEDRMICWCADTRCWVNLGFRHQEAITMRWAAGLMESMGNETMADALRQDAADMEDEYGLRT